jgi:8-oxo-dGTP diphosphatase
MSRSRGNGHSLELGETLQQGLVREVLEETGLTVMPEGIVEVLDRITQDEHSGRIRYHYVLIDFRCRVTGGTLCCASDAEEARWVKREELQEQGGYRLAPLTVQVIEKAFTLGRASDRVGEKENGA